MNHPFLKESIHMVRSAIDTYLSGEARTLLSLEPWGPDLRNRLHEYALRGKLVRGALVPFTWRVLRPEEEPPEQAAQGGVVMEMLQSFLLIHDDIMDQDDTRRGGPAMHKQFELLLQNSGKEQFGRSMGICAGDVAAFLALERISSMTVDPKIRSDLTALVASEIITTGLAQMQDVHHGYVENAAEEAIMQVYTYKTGRYTFSLPLVFGAHLAEAPPETVELLSSLGEHLGRIFQIRDDQLGVFGESDRIGKPAGSDIREDKKTIFREALFRSLPEDDPVRMYFGTDRLGSGELEAVREAIKRTGVMEYVNELVAAEQRSAQAILEHLELPHSGEEALRELLAYNEARTR